MSLKSTHCFLLFIAIALGLSSCLPDETECSYLEYEKEKFYSSPWHVDSFRIYIFDSTGVYSKDTTYINDGTFTFIPDDEGDCFYQGTIRFDRADGTSVSLGYKTSDYYSGFNNLITMTCSTSLDGYPAVYNTTLWKLLENNGTTMVIAGRAGYYYYPPAFDRQWEFYLTKN